MPDTGRPGPDTIKGHSLDILKEAALFSTDPHVRAFSLYLLALEGNPSLKNIFLSSLRDRDKRVRSRAAMALAGLGADALPDLIDLLCDDDWRIRYRAAEALGEIRSAVGTAHLIRVVDDDRDHVRYMAIKSLGSLEEKAAVTSIIPRLLDENVYVRRMAAVSLGKIGGEDALSALRKALHTEASESVRGALRVVLKKDGTG